MAPWVTDLLSIESIQVNAYPGEGLIYGEVIIESGSTSNFIAFQRSKTNPEPKAPGDFLTLTGPSSTVMAHDTVLVYVSLYDEDDDHEIAIGTFHHNLVSAGPEVYDRPLYEVVEGKYGSVTVQYSFISPALLAKIEVSVDGGDGRERVFGAIKARQYLGRCDKTTSITLFEKSADQSVAVGDGDIMCVPLDLCYVVAPANRWGSCLKIEVDLLTKLGDCEVVIGEGTVKFELDEGGKNLEKVEKISGNGGRYGVRVSINCANN